MNLLVLQVPIHKVKDNTIKGNHSILNYTVILNEARITNYNHSILLPGKTVILNEARELLKNDWDSKEFNLSFTQEKLMKDYQNLKIQKKVNIGLLKSNEIINELLDKTPIMIEKDSIKQSMKLIALSKVINSYETIIPHNLLNSYIKLRKSVEKIKPINTSLNLASMNNGFTYLGIDTLKVKEGFRVKHWPEKGTYKFGNNFYSLGNLGRISLALEDLWNR